MTLILNGLGTIEGASLANSPSVGNNSTGIATTEFVNNQLNSGLRPATLTSLNSGPLAGFRNRIINGGFDLWRLGASASGTNPNFGPDRFMTQSDASQTLSRVDYISSASGLYAARFTKNNTATYINFGTVIENGYNNTVVGNIVTFSCLMRASSALTLPMQILKGTGFDMVTQLSSVDKSVITSWTKFSITLDGTALSYDGTNKHLRVSIGNLGGLAISGWVEFKDFQLEVGSVATPFEYRPVGVELALCQRYLPIIEASYLSYHLGVAVSTTKAQVVIPFVVQARVPPTGIVCGGGYTVPEYKASFDSPYSASNLVASTALKAADKNGALIEVEVSDGLVVGRGGLFTLAGNYLQFTGAEL